MSTLLVKNIRAIVSCDGNDTVYENANLFCKDGLIDYIGPEERKADKVIDGSGMLCYPGLVNAHHHLYQVFSRNLEKVQNMELFDWLKTLYEIWKNLNEDTVYLSSLTGMGELMKNGCTTVFDHHYVFPAGAGDLIGAQAAAADKLGVRMHFSRGSMDLSVKDGENAADAGCFALFAVSDDQRLAHAQSGHAVDMARHNAHITGNRADNQFLRFAIELCAIRRDNTQVEAFHFASLSRNLATTSSMVPAKRK